MKAGWSCSGPLRGFIAESDPESKGATWGGWNPSRATWCVLFFWMDYPLLKLDALLCLWVHTINTCTSYFQVPPAMVSSGHFHLRLLRSNFLAEIMLTEGC